MRRYILIVAMVLFGCVISHAEERDCWVECPWGRISATLSVPADGSDTAVLIVAGSGPTDRNGNSGLNLNTYCYKMLSDALVERGLAVMRYDKRAIGLSYVDAATIPQLVFTNFVDDAARCVEYLRSEGFSRIVVAGHSEGGAIALHLALRDEVQVDDIVLLSAAGYPMDTILMQQLSAQLVPQYMGLMVSATNILQRIKRGDSVAAEDIPRELLALFHPTVQPFLCSSMAFDPRELMSRVKQPALIISGGRDIQVSVDNAERLIEVAAQGCHRHLPNMSHVLKDAPTSDRMEQLMGVYINTQLPLSEGLCDAIVEFINNK